MKSLLTIRQRIISLFCVMAALLLMVSCTMEKSRPGSARSHGERSSSAGFDFSSKKYVIGVSQCSEDSWRNKLEAELEQSTYFNEDVKLIMCSADDNMEQQSRQIDSLINLKVDLLIVSPQQVSKLSSAIKHATEAHIPVILFDRKSDVQNYTAFMGADNYEIGKMLGDFAATQLGGHGNIVEIGGEHGSSPAIERHNGFRDAISKYPGMKVIGYDEGDWKEASGEKAMEHIIDKLNSENPNFTINCVFGGNDRMAVGAHRVIDHYRQTHPSSTLAAQSSHIVYLGIDALPTSGGGIEKVRDGILTASAIYPTHGDELMQLALNILKGEPYEKTNTMETSIVTQDNANVLLLQHKEVANQHSYIKRMNTRVIGIVNEMNTERIVLFAFLIIIVLLAILFVVAVRMNRAKHHLINELQAKNEALNKEKETVERQREELEEQEDLLLDATAPPPCPSHGRGEDTNEDGKDSSHTSPLPGEGQGGGAFLTQFLECLDKRIADSDLSVEDIGKDMLMSRVNLYRKIKTLTGKTPVEIIREERLKRAHVLLQDSSLSVSEVAYKVGFSAPSYFAKCYKSFYGKAPSEE